jgi:hypothetical protein
MLVIEEKLRDRTVRARIDLALEHFDIRGRIGRVRVLFGIGADGHLEIIDGLDPPDEIG